MAGIKLTIPAAFTDTALPILRDDPMLAAGSLALIEPGHPVAPLAAVPAAGGSVPNIAWREAVSLGAAVSESGASATFGRTGFNGASGTIERTGKGALHGIASQVAGITNDGARLDLPTTLKTYIAANPAHAYYVSQWTRTTRATTGTGAGGTHERRAQIVGLNAGGQYLYSINQLSTGPGAYPATVQLGRRMSGGATGATVVTMGVNTWTGGAPAAADIEAAAALWGPVGRFSGSRVPNMHSSWILYRFYLEDLTASGRSYAQADAMDLQEYTKHVLTAGGRYYADTYTDPATIA